MYHDHFVGVHLYQNISLFKTVTVCIVVSDPTVPNVYLVTDVLLCSIAKRVKRVLVA